MKKLITVALTLFYTGGMLFAQLPAPKPKDLPKNIVKEDKVELKFRKTSAKRTAAGPTWFTPSETIRNFNGGPTSAYSYTTIFPDTNALFTYTDGQGGTVTNENIVNSVGLIFDPRSQIYSNDAFVTTRFSNYTVDSLRFTFFYRRFNTDPNMVDTIIVTTFDRTSISRGFNTIYAGAVDYTTDRYRASGANATVTTLLLTIDDTASTAQERTIAVNKTVSASNNGSNYFGATISYLPGYKGYNHGLPFDTVANFFTMKKSDSMVNTFRVLGYYDPNMYTESTTIPPINGTRIYNHGIVAEPTQRYKLIANVDYYYPAFYNTSHLFPAIDFLVKSPNVSVNSLSSATISNIYPNPAKGGNVMVELKSEVSANAHISITDVTGKVIKTLSHDLTAGDNNISLNVDGLSKGIYFVAVKAEGINTISKLTIE